MSAIDRGPRECRRKAATCQNVIRREVVDVAVEDFELRRLYVHGAYDQTDRARSQPAEVHVFRE